MTDEAQREMPKYKCHKEVWALKIVHVDPSCGNSIAGPNEETDGGAILTFHEAGYGPLKVDAAYIKKHRPQPGGYYVVYQGGYQSWSPGDVFESGYTPA